MQIVVLKNANLISQQSRNLSVTKYTHIKISCDKVTFDMGYDLPVSVHHTLDFCGTLGLRMTSISRDFILNNFFPHELFFFSFPQERGVTVFDVFPDCYLRS